MIFGQPRRHYAECGSTNDLARVWAADPIDPAPHGALVSADYQTHGRGQRERRWYAPPGECALMSFVVRPSLSWDQVPFLGLMTALAVVDALESFGAMPCLKWPNDVLLSGRKVAGILAETFSASVGPENGALTAVLGIGVNVRQTEFPDSSQYVTPPTSLNLELGTELAVDTVRDAITIALAQRFDNLEQNGVAVVYGDWQARLCEGSVIPGTFVEMGVVNGEVRANSV